jgi:hypothetical protein
MLRSQISRLRDRRKRDRSEVREELGELGPDRFHHHRIGGADEGAPRLLFPQLKVFCRNEFVADHPAGDQAEPGLVACVDELLGTGRVEMGDRLRAQDQDPVALGGDCKSPPDLAVYLDRAVRTGRETLPAPDTRFVNDLQQERLVAGHSDGVGGAHAHTREARDTRFRVYDEVQVTGPVGAGGEPTEM